MQELGNTDGQAVHKKKPKARAPMRNRVSQGCAPGVCERFCNSDQAWCELECRAVCDLWVAEAASEAASVTVVSAHHPGNQESVDGGEMGLTQGRVSLHAEGRVFDRAG